MWIYFFAANASKRERALDLAVRALKDAGISSVASFDERSLARYRRQYGQGSKGPAMIDSVQGLVIEGSEPDGQIGYLMALALSRELPIMYLLEKGKPLDESLSELLRNKRASRLVTLAQYDDGRIERIMHAYAASIDPSGRRTERPSVKFTLRITPSMERYLEWRAGKARKSKADFLRDHIQSELVDKDEQWRKRISA